MTVKVISNMTVIRKEVSTLKTQKLYPMCGIVILVSLLGFMVENVWLALRYGSMDNRNMHLPFLLGYGLAIVAIYFCFGTPDRPRLFHLTLDTGRTWLNMLVYFLITCACVMIGECLLGTLVERTTGIVWWNYTSIPGNITKYTSIPTTIGFGALITTFMRFFFLPLYQYFYTLDAGWFHLCITVLMVLLSLDLCYSALRMYRTRSLMTLWRIHLPSKAVGALSFLMGG